MPKFEEKEKAIKLRKQGFSYSEILKEIPVAKSTLSLWLRSVGLSQEQKQKLTKKKLAAALRGAQARRDHRLAVTKEIKDKAIRDIGEISDRELWLIGAALYWAEGAKQKEYNISQVVKFSNSDPLMVKIFLRWLLRVCGIPRSEIFFRVNLHKTAESKLIKVNKYWVDITDFPASHFHGVDWKRSKIKTVRKNTGDNYYGLLNIYIKNSTNLNRKIGGWIEGISKHCGVV